MGSNLLFVIVTNLGRCDGATTACRGGLAAPREKVCCHHCSTVCEGMSSTFSACRGLRPLEALQKLGNRSHRIYNWMSNAMQVCTCVDGGSTYFSLFCLHVQRRLRSMSWGSTATACRATTASLLAASRRTGAGDPAPRF